MTAQTIDQMPTQPITHLPPSILVSRSEALRYVESCELAEMMPSRNNHNFLSQFLQPPVSNSGDGTDDNHISSDSGGGVNKYASIIQMAFLLYLGEYVHARHLWRRHRSSNNSNGGDDYNNQLSKFWNTAKYCYLWDTGGISSIMINSTVNEDINDESANNLPYSTMMLRSFESNAKSSLEPLCQYSKELIDVFRYRVNDRLRLSFGDIREDEFMLRMNLSSDNNEGGAGGDDELLGRYGWQRRVERAGVSHLVPDKAWKSPIDVQRGEDGGMSMDDNRIHQLSEVVMFLEQTKMNA